jgi:acyl transferase domain-containing protein
MQYKDPEGDFRYTALGVGISLLANRLSYFYDLRGPSMQIDTACSSSLIGCHLACASLRQRESSMVGLECLPVSLCDADI